jgi:DNA-binding CsgD family transcriptional regulator
MATGACLASTTAPSSALTGTAEPKPLLATLSLFATALSRLGLFGWRRKTIAKQPSPALAAHPAATSGHRKRPAKRRLELTPREREVALLLSRGLSNDEIALELGLKCGTVKIYVHNVLVKLGARNRLALIRRSMGRAHSFDITDPRGVLPPNDASDNAAAGYRAPDGERPGLAWTEDARALAAI